MGLEAVGVACTLFLWVSSKYRRDCRLIGGMEFSETYREERLINRRSRGRKARILGRIIGFGLSACLLMALRTDPQLRDMVQDLTLAVIGGGDAQHASAEDVRNDAIRGLGYTPGSQEAQALEQLGISGERPQARPNTGQMPQSRIKINRPGSG
jgi:hypothetical protein